MDRYTETAGREASITLAEKLPDPPPLLSTRPHRHHAIGKAVRDTEGSVVAARFALYAMAQEALDEGRLWFSDEDLICLHAFPGDDARENELLAGGGYLLTRVRDPDETRRAADIMLGRGATRVDVLSPDYGLYGSLARAFAQYKTTTNGNG